MRRPLVALLVAGVVTSGAAPARAATPIPPWREDRVAVAGTADTFDPLRRFLADFQGEAGAQYHVVVVARSDPRDRAGPEHSGSASSSSSSSSRSSSSSSSGGSSFRGSSSGGSSFRGTSSGGSSW